MNDSDSGAELKLRYDQHGNVTEIAYFGTDSQPITQRGIKAARTTRSYDDRGNLIEVSFFGPDGQSVRGALGVAKQKVVWLEQGRTLETFFGPDGKPVPILGRIIKLRGTYDKRGYVVEFAGFDENDRPIPNDAGCAIQEMSRDRHDLRAYLSSSHFGRSQWER